MRTILTITPKDEIPYTIVIEGDVDDSEWVKTHLKNPPKYTEISLTYTTKKKGEIKL